MSSLLVRHPKDDELPALGPAVPRQSILDFWAWGATNRALKILRCFESRLDRRTGRTLRGHRRVTRYEFAPGSLATRGPVPG